MRLIDADLLGLTDMEIIMCDGDYKEALKMLIDKIEHSPTIDLAKPHWIPCSERLPEDGKEVYVTSGKGRWAFTTEGKFSRRFGGWVSAWDNDALSYVVAWMPEPEPWRGDAE